MRRKWILPSVARLPRRGRLGLRELMRFEGVVLRQHDLRGRRIKAEPE